MALAAYLVILHVDGSLNQRPNFGVPFEVCGYLTGFARCCETIERGTYIL